MEYTKGNFKDGNTGWKAHEPSVKIGFATHEIHYSDDGECVAEVVHGQNEANLMAAAPQMYEALKRLMTEYKSIADSGDFGAWQAEEQEEYKQAMAAIKSAEGK